MKSSVFTVCTPEYDLESTAKLLKELGYDGVEWRVAGEVPQKKPDNWTFENRYWTYNLSTVDVSKILETAPVLKDISLRYNLEICCLSTYLGLWDTKNIENTLKAAGIAGCRNIRVNVPVYDGSENYRTLFNRSQEQLKALEKLAASYEKRIIFEIHMGNITPSASAAYRLISPFDPRFIGVIYDPGNLVTEGYENYQMGMELLGEYLAHVHIKNSAWKQAKTEADGTVKYRTAWVPFKEGCADLKKVLGLLKAAGYDGFVSVEDFSNDDDTRTKLQKDIEFIKSV